MNSAVRKIHNLLSSGAVTVTGPNQPRILKQKVGVTTVSSSSVNSNNSVQQNNYVGSRCYVCDDAVAGSSVKHLITEMNTSHTNTKFPNKIGQLVGDAFMVIVSVEDVVCARCTNLMNYLDRLENDVERVRTNILNLLNKKYGLNEDGGGSGTQSVTQSGCSPPSKMQKLTSNVAAINRVTNNSSDDGGERVRKSALVHHDGTLGKPPVSAVQQIKISTPQSQQSSQTQTVQRKTTKIYKCLTCDYKTSDMRLFNTHYETCKQQNFQCKNCKKIFPNFGAMKQHMIKDHNTPMDNTCAVCHINFVSDQALRKHMEINHSTNVVVTSSTTIPAAPTAEAISAHQSTTTSTPLYTCNHCQFKSTDKPVFDEHMRKHMPGNKPKPFKCRLCSQRFETREQATVHAKQHQPNYFKCGTCSMSFPKRELLVKHFEVHQQQRQQSPQPPQKPQTVVLQQQTVTHTQPTTTTTNSTLLTTQKLLQETIDEALSDTVPTTTTETNAGGGANANIRFFSCHICSLTFIQENYYNQHMETHKREKKAGAVTTTASSVILTNSSSLASLSSNAGLLSEGVATSVPVKSENHLGVTASSGGAMQHSNSTTSAATISEADIESIFEKMHSDKGDGGSSEATPSTSGTTAAGDNLVITSQAGSGGITFNITIPQPDGGSSVGEQSSANKKSITASTTATPVSVSIDMPMLDQPDEKPANKLASAKGSTEKKINSSKGSISTVAKQATGPVSMPSLDDENDAQDDQAPAHTEDQLKQEQEKDSAEVGDHKVTSESEKNSAKPQSYDNDDSASNTHPDSNVKEEHTDAANNSVTDEASAEHMEETGDQQQVTMELDEAMQAQVEGGQIKFILNENGQLLQLENHIITDADGNQILVQDPEQIQQLLQSVGVLQSGEGLDGETLQMMTDANGQMVLVQGDNNETQLIDASLLNADGQLVIQQGADGELGEGAHVIGEDGTRIPVSVSYTADGQPIVQVQQQVLESAEGQQLLSLEKDASQDAATSENAQGDASTGGGFFALEDLMQQSADAANAKDAE